ncbi:MAG: hypothetical protein FJ271_02710 [Planctomycetes bacterium]|nr:hypothetical protein [Planctomycetota bacterium]
MKLTHRWTLCAFLLLVMSGCGREVPERADTGSREVARKFFEAIINKDWRRAHAEVLQGQDAKEFAALAEAYHGKLGFEPAQVHIRACEEQGDDAIAHVTVSGRHEKQIQRYRDGIVLRRVSGHWRVVLPATFGADKRAAIGTVQPRFRRI